MATISITLEPPAIAAVNNPVLYKIFGAPYNEMHLAKISIYYIPAPNALAVPITSWEQQPEPGPVPVFNFNISQAIQEHLSYFIHPPNASGVQSPMETILKFQIQFQVLTFINGVKTPNSNTITKSFWGVNASLQHNEPNLNPYLLDGSQKQFLTHGPAEKDIRTGDSEVLSVLTNNTQGSFMLKVKSYDAIGNETKQELPMSSFLTKKRLDLPVGPGNIAQQWPGFLTNKTRYEVVVEPATTNLFKAGDNGTFDSNITNIFANPGVTVTHNTTRKKSGAASLQMQLYDATTTEPIAWLSSYHTLQPNTYYELKAHVYVEYLDVLSWGLILMQDGFSDAVVLNQDFAKVYIRAFHQAQYQNYFDQWIPLTLAFRTGNDVTGRFGMKFTGTMQTLQAFVDDVTLMGQVAAARKITYHIKPACGHETRVHFLNRLGAMDSYTFTGTERRNIRTEGNTYQRLKPFNYPSNARGRQVLQKNATVRLSCSSDVLRPDEMLWLEELLTSPAVYVQQDNQNVPVILRDGEFEIIDPTKNIHRLRVELEYANDMLLQRG